MNQEQKEKILSVLSKYTLGVLSTTTSDSLPESALVGFAETKDLELVFGCFYTTRKYKNLQSNQNVAFVVGGDDDKTIQYEGVVRELFGDEKDKYVAFHIQKKPSFEKYAKMPGNCYFFVEPKWIRYVDLNKNENWEITF